MLTLTFFNHCDTHCKPGGGGNVHQMPTQNNEENLSLSFSLLLSQATLVAMERLSYPI